MKVKWGNLLIFLLIIGGVVGYFQWDNIKPLIDKQVTQSRTTSVPTSKDAVVYARDTWITGSIPELGILRGYDRDYDLELTQAFYGDDTERLAAVGSGKAHFSEISWPSLIRNLERVENGKYADQIVVLGFIDYSRGGDGVIVQQGIKTVNDLVNKRVGYFDDGTSKYMLSFLLRMVDMRLEDVKGVPYTDEAKLQQDFVAGKLDAIAYWQPGINDVLKQKPGASVLLSTADMPTLIPDVLIANRAYVAKNQPKAEAFLKFWFSTVKHIQEKPDLAYDRWAEALNKATYTEGGKQEPIYGTDFDAKAVKEIFAKEIRLVGFDENLKLMGITQAPEIGQMIKFAVENWRRIEKITGPNEQIVFNGVLDAIKSDVTLKVGAIDPSKTGAAAPVQEKPKEFKQNADVAALNEVAQMAIPNIEFEPDATAITPAGKKVITEVLVPLLKQFPNFYLLIDGHTDVGGDPQVLTRLSLGRAEAVKKELTALGFPDAQMIVRGFGDTKPLFPNPKTAEEKAKNRRTEFRLLREPAR
jgi:outer membrane protein OmpA-like peptidoglycan-associated protein/ABC-type nitrate/sulfonate/bicarbonate transport system substrate-binding protein